MRISILLPYKENFSTSNAGAVSLNVRDTTTNSKFKNNILIFGETVERKKLLKNFVHINIGSGLHLSKTRSYVNKFIELQKKLNSEIIEVHNRPSYIKYLKCIESKLILYFHNDPLNMKDSTTVHERIKLLKQVNKIVFNSKWCKSRFTIGLNTNIYKNKLIVIPQSTSKTKINFNTKKKLISYIGKLNDSKGYDSFGASIIKILNEFDDWKAIVIGDEPRQKLFFNHKNLKLYGYKNNAFILNKLKKVSISVVPSRWNEPFGRASLEATSRGCAAIISNRGGLPETTKHALFIKKINEKILYKNIKKLILNDKLRLDLQKNAYKNFYLTNQYISKIIDNLRKKILLPTTNINTKSIKDRIKILHITNLNERFDGRLHYNTGKRINNGFIRLGHNVLSLSDRDILKRSKSFTDPYGTKTLNKKIINTQKNFKADLIVLGHADNVTVDTINKLKLIKNDVKICKWFLDPLIKNGPDYDKNKKRISYLNNFIDTTFITTHPDALSFKLKNLYFIPNPSDISFETLDNSKKNPSRDLFFAMSHGVHRGVLKGGKIDSRELFLRKLKLKLPNISFDIFGMNGNQPIWGDEFINNIRNYKMGLNLSRGKPTKYYSSDRIVQLMGNGLLTFINKKTKLEKIIKNNEAVYYNNLNDLVIKINYYLNNLSLLKKIASNGKSKYLNYLSSNNVCQYIINKSFAFKNKKKFIWEN